MKTKLFTLFLVLIASAGTMFASECFYSKDFRLSQGAWTIDNKALNGAPYVWQQTSNYGMKATAYVDGSRYETESWLISPNISLENPDVPDLWPTNATLVFSHARRYGDLSQLSVKVLVLDPDDPSQENTWTTVQVSSWPDGSNWNFMNAAVDLSPYVWHTIQIAFVYTSTTSAAATWEIKSVSIGEGVYKGIFYYTFNDFGGVTLISNPCGGTYYGDVYIPDSISYNGTTFSVTGIGERAFSDCTNLTSVKIPSSVKRIESKAFYNCTGLTSVTFSSTTPLPMRWNWYDEEYIDSTAFKGCSQLSNIYVPCGYKYNYISCYEGISEDLKPLVKYVPLAYKIEGKALYEETGTVECPTICDDTTITALPALGYEFVCWTDGNTTNPRKIELTQDTIFTAVFAKSQYSITTQSSNPEWGITVGDATANYGDVIEISAIPNDGYHFKYWIGDSVSRCDAWSGGCNNWCMSGHWEYPQHPEQNYSVNVTSSITYTAVFEKDSQEESIPEVSAPADGYVTIVIEIPENSECNGIAFKGTMDGTNWSAPNTYVGETMADASVAECIKFFLIDNGKTWYKATYKLGTIGLIGKVCLIYTNDNNWDGQAYDYSIIDANTTANASIDADGNIVIANTGVVYLKIGGWGDSDCEESTPRTVVLLTPPYICGGDTPTIAGEFNYWQPTAFPMTQIVNDYNMFYAKMDAKDIQHYKFAGVVNGWDNQIQIYDQEWNTWNNNPDLCFGNKMVLVVDYSTTDKHRWSKAEELPCTSLNQVRPYSGSSVNITSADLSKGKVLIYSASTTLILIAVPEPDMQFVAWSDGNTDNPRAMTWEQDLTMTASFVEEGTNTATDIDIITSNNSIVSLKLFRNGQIYIHRGDKTYTLQGQEIK